MLLLGIDLGTSSVKVSVIDGDTQLKIASAQYPDLEAPILTPGPGMAEQDPEQWWLFVKQAILRAHSSGKYNPADISAIGIAYQMHGLVALDANGTPVRNSIIWCDSRAVPYGEKAFQAIGEEKALGNLLNSPGNFTAAKLAWVKENEPEVFARINKVMLPGDYIAYRLTGEFTTSVSALSEGVFWDFKNEQISEDVMAFFGFDGSLIPSIAPLFGSHGRVTEKIAGELQLTSGMPVTYKAGDQPNNALSLNVMKPGEVAATAGTSGVIYGVADTLVYDKQSRINSFAHVNHTSGHKRIGVLLCINGCGILNKSVRELTGGNLSYPSINQEAAGIKPGSDGLTILPFGNGAERMLGNQCPGAQVHGWDFNRHGNAHFYRAVQEGIAFAFRYGFDIMRENGMQPGVIRAGNANMFLSGVFSQTLVDILGIPVELYDADGSVGAAMGAGVGAGFFGQDELGKGLTLHSTLTPGSTNVYEHIYQRWLNLLKDSLP